MKTINQRMLNNSVLSINLVLALSFSGLGQPSKEVIDLISKGMKKVEAGNASEALTYYDKAVQLDPENLDALAKRAFARSILKDYHGTIEDYTRIIELAPSQVIAYISRGSAYNKLMKFDLAIKDFDQALTMDPKNQEAYNNRGWSKKGLGDKAGACEDWKTSKKMGNQEAKIILKNNQC